MLFFYCIYDACERLEHETYWPSRVTKAPGRSRRIHSIHPSVVVSRRIPQAAYARFLPQFRRHFIRHSAPALVAPHRVSGSHNTRNIRANPHVRDGLLAMHFSRGGGSRAVRSPDCVLGLDVRSCPLY
jgi:hypothetical protein